jgi:hypothetical protein
MSALFGYSPVAPNPSGAACYTTVDPHYSETGAPGRMADGRLVTDYRPRCFQYPILAAQKWGDNVARERMIHGAEELMAAARAVNDYKNTPTSCEDTMVPELYQRVCTWDRCKTIPGNYQGIGTGRIYVPSSADYASSPQAMSDMNVPAIPNTYPRRAPRFPSQCGADDSAAWSIQSNTTGFVSGAQSHPYSAPRA